MECPKCKEESDYKIERDNEVIFRCGNKSCTVMVFVSKSAWRGSYNAKYCYCFVHWFWMLSDLVKCVEIVSLLLNKKAKGKW